MGSPASPSHAAVSDPAGGFALLGPLLTERQFAQRAGMSRREVRSNRCIPRIGSSIGLEAAYPAFMLGPEGLRLDLAFVTLLVRRRVSDLETCDWLVRRNPRLGGQTPLDWIVSGLALEEVIEVLPIPAARPTVAPLTEVDAIREEWLRFRGDDETPGWSVAWDRIARRATATPHGI